MRTAAAVINPVVGVTLSVGFGLALIVNRRAAAAD